MQRESIKIENNCVIDDYVLLFLYFFSPNYWQNMLFCINGVTLIMYFITISHTSIEIKFETEDDDTSGLNHYCGNNYTRSTFNRCSTTTMPKLSKRWTCVFLQNCRYRFMRVLKPQSLTCGKWSAYDKKVNAKFSICLKLLPSHS